MKSLKKMICFFLILCMFAVQSQTEFGGNLNSGLVTKISPLTGGVSETNGLPAVTKLSLRHLTHGLPIFQDMRTAEAASVSIPYYFAKPGGGANENINSGDEIALNSASLVIYVGSDQASGGQPLQRDSAISFYSSNPEVVSVMPYSDASGVDNRTITLVRNGPGYTQIAAYMPDGSLITLLVRVELEVIKTTAGWRNIALTLQKMLILNVGDTYNTTVKYLNDASGITVDNALLDWAEDSEVGKIVSVSDTGVITARGAGLATVTISTQTYNSSGSPMSESFKVLVVPKGSDTYSATYAGYAASVETLKTTGNFQLFTNTTQSQNLRWKVYAKENGGGQRLLLTTNNTALAYETDVLDFAISSESGVLTFTNAKAGTYKIYGYAYDSALEYDPTGSWASLEHLEFTVEVGLDIADQTLVMNVGDTYSITENSNIPTELLTTLFTFSSDASSIASVNTSGEIYARTKGNATILIHYDRDSAQGLYTAGSPYYNLVNTDIYYRVSVIDGISLNATYLSMYTGATYMLEASATDRNTTIYWTSSNPSVATVENGEIKALTAGSTVITAMQTIDGIVKKATCTVSVQPSVTDITLNPNEVTMEIGDFTTIVATLVPNNITGVDITWISSDESIFTVSETTRLTATIEAKKGGEAVLTAINGENIVAGSSRVIVNQPVTGLTLSESSVTVELATGIYQLHATLTPDNATNKTVLWQSTDTSIATVDATGRITLRKSGQVSIIATSEDNPLMRAICNVTILKAVSGINLDVTSLEMYVGETYRMTYLVTPTSASNTAVDWTSFNTSVLTVDSTGMLTARQAGTTQVMVMTRDGSFYSICSVVVKQRATGVKMSITNLTMNKDEYFVIDVTVTPTTATEASLIWESQDETVATVTSKGRVTAKGVGTTIIMVKTTTGASAYCSVTVMDGVTQLDLDPEEAIIDIGDTLEITPKFTPATASNTTVKWTSNNESVATVNAAGVVKAIKGGTSLITCESEDGGYRAFCLITVYEPVVSIEMNESSYILGLDKTYQLTATVLNDETATDTEVKWTSSNARVVTVDKTGKITGISIGTATVTATAADGEGAQASCTVQVVREVTSVKLDISTITLLVGEQYAFQSTVLPSNATYTKPVFSSSDEVVAMIDPDGILTALKAGTTMVQAKAADNSGKYAQCYVTVINPIPATGLTVSDTEVVMAPGEVKTIVLSVKPATSTDGFTWSSNNDGIAKVDDDGTITAVTTGTATITVMADSGKKATVAVTVVGLSETYLELPVYSSYSRLYVDGATGTVRWMVDDKRVCQITNGTIITRSVGTTTIYATVNGRQLSCVIKVVP